MPGVVSVSILDALAARRRREKGHCDARLSASYQRYWSRYASCVAPTLSRSRCRRSDGHLDAIDANLKFGNVSRNTLSQHRDLLEGLHLVDRYEMGIQVHELDADLLEGPLRQQMPFDARQRLVRVVVRLRASSLMA